MRSASMGMYFVAWAQVMRHAKALKKNGGVVEVTRRFALRRHSPDERSLTLRWVHILQTGVHVVG